MRVDDDVHGLHNSNIRLGVDDDVHGLHMFDSDVQLDHEVNIDNDHKNLESDEEELPPSVSKKKQKRGKVVEMHSFRISRVIPRRCIDQLFVFE